MKLVSEIGINANGDVRIAKKLIDAAVLGGCEYIKLQKRDIESVYTKEELDKERESPFGTTNREQKNGIEFSKEQYDLIDKYCKEKGIKWYASPWDIKSLDFLLQYDTPYIKIASAMNSNEKLINKIKESGKPVILSTGMTNAKELKTLVEFLGDQVRYILSCTSTYPTKEKDMNMNRIHTLQKEYGWAKTGFSNHAVGILYIIQAAVMGCQMIEYHVTLSRSMYGSDQASSIEIPGMLKIKDYVDGIQAGWGDGEIKCLKNELPIKAKLRNKGEKND